MTPALEFLPNSVPCGPRSTSIRSMSTKSLNASPARLKTTPSSTVETEGSPAIEKVAVPTPRRNSDWLSVVPDFRKLSDGTRYCAPSRLTRPCCASASPLITETASGTSCNRSLRFCAVTMISSEVVASGAAAVTTGVCACAAAASANSAVPARIVVRIGQVPLRSIAPDRRRDA